MDVSAAGVFLSAEDVAALATKLATIATVHHVTDLAPIAHGFAIVSAAISAEMTLADEPPTMTTTEYAKAVGLTDRAIRYRIERKELAARMEGTKWQIPASEVGRHHKTRLNAG